jgi:MFS family permease
MAPIALAFAVLDLTGSATDLGWVLAASWIPQIVFILVGGVWADRLPRNVVMVAANAVSGAAQAAVAVLLLTGAAQLWELIALQVARGIAISFFFPASQGITPQVVEADELQQANAVLRLCQTGTSILGAAAGGALVAVIGSGWAIAFDAGTYFASATLLARMRTRLRPQHGQSSFMRELAEGWNEFRSRTWLWVVVAAAAFGNMAWVGSQAVLGPVVAKESLHGATGWGIVIASESVGLVVAGLVALRWQPRRLLLYGVFGLLVTPLLLVALAVPFSLPAVSAAAVIAGFGIELFNVYWVTALQQHIPDEVLARVNSYDALGSFVFIPVGLTLVGPLADAIGVSTTIWCAAALSTVTGLTALSSRQVRRLRRIDPIAIPSPEPESAPVPIR